MSAYHLRATLLPDGDAPSDLWVVDGKITFVPQDGGEELMPAGGFALPGLVDCHYHLTLDLGANRFKLALAHVWQTMTRHSPPHLLGLPAGSPELVREGLERHLKSGTTLIRDVGVVSDAIPATAAPGLPRVQSAGRFIAPADGYFGFQEDTPAEELVARARAQAEAGHPWVKIIADFPRKRGHYKTAPANYPLDVMQQAVEEAHAGGARVASHAISRAGVELAIAAGVDSLEHGPSVDETLLATMAERGIAWTPTLVIQPRVISMVEGMGDPDATSGIKECFANERLMIAAAHRLGVTILVGTDMLPPGSVWREVAALQQAGLEPRAALAAASTAARSFLREPALAEAAPADLVWYERDPRNDPELLAQPGLVLLGGQRVS